MFGVYIVYWQWLTTLFTVAGFSLTSFSFIFAAGGLFFPVTTAIGSGLYAISTYGGVVLFSGFMLYDTQVIVAKAENHPIASPHPFDPVNA